MEHVIFTAKEVVTFSKVYYLINFTANFYDFVILLNIKGCGVLQWIECAGVVAACAAVCVGAEVDLPACMDCMGGLFDICKDCFSYVDKEGR